MPRDVEQAVCWIRPVLLVHCGHRRALQSAAVAAAAMAPAAAGASVSAASARAVARHRRAAGADGLLLRAVAGPAKRRGHGLDRSAIATSRNRPKQRSARHRHTVQRALSEKADRVAGGAVGVCWRSSLPRSPRNWSSGCCCRDGWNRSSGVCADRCRGCVESLSASCRWSIVAMLFAGHPRSRRPGRVRTCRSLSFSCSSLPWRVCWSSL